MLALTPRREDPPLARLSAVFALVVGLAACADVAPEPEPAAEPDVTVEAPADDAEAPQPKPEPDPEPDPLASLPAEVLATREALLGAARAGDWEAVGALMSTELRFTSNYGGETDHVAYLSGLDEDVLAEVVLLLEDPYERVGEIQVGEVFVWPELHARVPFAVSDDERPDLEARFGADALAEWEAAGAYLGWRIGITTEGEWIFLVAGD